MFSQIKDRKHIEQNFHSVAKVMPRDGTGGAGGDKNFSVGICDGAPSTARSSINITFPDWVIVKNIIPRNVIINRGAAEVDNII